MWADQFLDDAELDVGGGIELGKILIHEHVEDFLRLVREDDAAGCLQRKTAREGESHFCVSDKFFSITSRWRENSGRFAGSRLRDTLWGHWTEGHYIGHNPQRGVQPPLA